MKAVKKVTWDGLENFEDELEDGRCPCGTCGGYES
jgi:hypothetical protein